MPRSLKEQVRPYYLRWLYFRLHPERRPSGFVDCWKYPYEKLTPASRFSARNLPDLIFYPMTDWHTRIQRTQHLVRAFAGAGYRCLFVNPHLGREFDTSPLDGSHRLARIGENIFELHVRLPREPVFHERLLLPEEEQIVEEAVRQVLPASGEAVQILSFPLWTGVARRFAGFPVIYDCHDLLSGFRNIAPDLLAAEAKLLETADLVLFSSQGLMDRYPGVRRSLLVRNAVSVEQFAVPRNAPPGPPIVGYVGALDSWFDIEAVEQAAAANPRFRFVLAGRVEFEAIRRLQSHSNVELIGEIPHERVPEVMAQFRVGLIPFRVNALTLMTNPIKLYEYFSSGMPVVSTPLPEAQAMGDLVYTADGPADFARQVSRGLEEDDAALRSRRHEVARRESWTARAVEIGGAFAGLKACPQSRRD